MHTPFRFLLLLGACGATTACSRDEVTLRGTLGTETSFDSAVAWVVGGGEPVRLDGRAFRLTGVPAGPVDLRLRLDGERELRLALDTLPPGAEVELRDLWVDDERGLAFPASVEGVRMLGVNGLRFAPMGRLPREVDTPARVLAVGGDGAALLVRPADEQLPDLRVAVTPATAVLSASGEPADAERLEPGDSVQVVGELRQGVVVARRLVQ